ncbi:hypothetical protein ACN28I_04840 [Archangium gephyra]|uniref:hypothetical protein n=1 Tax=Archangium gephyra TaxID=48 RepID=UPI003B7C2055
MPKLRNAVVATLAVCSLVLGLSQATAAEKNPLIGHYTLRGVSEVGSELVLKEDGRFEYGLAYGGHEESVTGTWKQTAKGVTLKADRDPRPPSLTFKGSRFSEYGDDKDSVNVDVGNKAMGLVFSGMDVEFRFKSGNTLKGQTGRSGRLGVQGPFGGDQLVRVGVAYNREKVAMVWHDVKDTKDNIFEFKFEPGRLKTPAFDELELRKDKGALVRTQGEELWRYEKQ